MADKPITPLQKMHDLSLGNLDLLTIAGQARCFNCGATPGPADIKHVVEDKEGRTAFCPTCGIDALLPDLTPELLAALKRHYL